MTRNASAGFALFAALLAPPAYSLDFNAALCDDDGVTETPSWATRDGNGCLLVPTGPSQASSPPSHFQPFNSSTSFNRV
jgi:hypothetical protein